jgi:hypothetical protein
MDENSEQERRRFVRLDLAENVRALDAMGRDIGRVEKVGAGGMQIRLSDNVPEEQYGPGTKLNVSVVEPGNVRNDFKVEVRVRDGKILGVQFLN